MASGTRSGRRWLLRVAALLFGGTTAFYSIIWVTYAMNGGVTNIGLEFTYSLPSRYLKVSRVEPGSNAQRAGLRPGDKILAVNGSPLDTLTPYYDWVSGGHTGDAISLRVLHPGEKDPSNVTFTLASPVPVKMFRSLTPARMVALQIMRTYPLVFLVVGLAVLFLKVEDRNAWLLALFFAGFIALPDISPGGFPSAFRGFFMSFHVVMSNLAPAFLYLFLAIFPAPSPLERSVPWLKWIFLALCGVFAAVGLWTIISAKAYESVWIPLDFGGPAWRGPAIRMSGFFLGLGAEGLAVVSLLGNSFWALTPEAQRKARMIVWGMVCGLLPIMLLVSTLNLTGRKIQDVPFWLYSFCVLALFLLPLSFAYAVVKHRVLEIPVLLKRSARYLLVQRGFLFLILLLVWGTSMIFVSVFTRFLESRSMVALPVGLGAGIALGALLTWGGNQAARRGTRRIDRAFFRNAYDARVILEDLVEQVRSGKDRQNLAAMLEQQIGSALHPRSMSVYFESTPGLLRIQSVTAVEGVETISAQTPLLAELARQGKPWEVAREFRGESTAGSQIAKAEFLVPITAREGLLIGVIGLGPRLSEEPYSREDKRLLGAVASQVGLALESLQLAEQMAERIESEQRVAREMEIAREVQARLLPQELPRMQTLEYAGTCIQARQVGGDYYDFLELRPGRLALVLADIAGKGVSGALLMAHLQANLRSQYAMAIDDLPRLFTSVNRLFCQNTDEANYATLFFADYDDSSRRLRYVNCGHLPPLVLRAGQDLQAEAGVHRVVERLESTSTVVGLFENWECSIGETALSPGDILVMYTDGVTEAEDAAGQDFGECRLLDALRSNAHLPAENLLRAVVSAVRAFSASEQRDDITLVIARCLP